MLVRSSLARVTGRGLVVRGAVRGWCTTAGTPATEVAEEGADGYGDAAARQRQVAQKQQAEQRDAELRRRVTEETRKRVAALDEEAKAVPDEEWAQREAEYWRVVGVTDPLQGKQRAGGMPTRITRWNQPKVQVREVPEPRAPYDTPEKFLTRIGKGCEEHKDAFESWDQLFTADHRKLKGMGIKPTQRRWILRWVQKYRLGVDPLTHQNNLYYNHF